MIRERIKSETAELHMEVEQFSFAHEIMSSSLTKSQYSKIIKSNYLINKSFEDGWSRVDSALAEKLNLEQRRKVPSLLKDLSELGMTTPEHEDMPINFEDNAEFMGALYVFEGSTLGGAVIYKHLIKNPNLESFKFNFYNCYGDNIGLMWRQYLEQLVQITDAKKVDLAVNTAKGCFSYIKKVMSSVNSQDNI